MKSLLFGEAESWIVSSLLNTCNEASSSETEKEMLKKYFAQIQVKIGRELFPGSWRQSSWQIYPTRANRTVIKTVIIQLPHIFLLVVKKISKDTFVFKLLLSSGSLRTRNQLARIFHQKRIFWSRITHKYASSCMQTKMYYNAVIIIPNY